MYNYFSQILEDEPPSPTDAPVTPAPVMTMAPRPTADGELTVQRSNQVVDCVTTPAPRGWSTPAPVTLSPTGTLSPVTLSPTEPEPPIEPEQSVFSVESKLLQQMKLASPVKNYSF